MTAGPNRLQRLKDKVFRVVLDGVRRITEPSAKVEPQQRRRIRLLAAFTLIMSVNALIGSLYMKRTGGDIWMVMLATVIAFALGYFISRTRHYRIALGIAITAPAVPSFAFGILQPLEMSNTTELMWLALPLLVASVMLAVRQTILVAVIYLLLISSFGIYGLIDLATMAQVLSFISIIAFFVITITRIRRKDQAELENQLSERLKIEGILRVSEEKFRNLFENAKDAVLLADARTGIIVDINPAGCELLGLSKEEAIGRHQTQIHPPEMAEKYKGVFQEHVEKGMVVSEDTVIQRADGSQVQCEVSASVIRLQDKQIIQGVFRDITERKRMEKTLADEATRRRILIEESHDGIVILDQEGKVYEANRRFAEMLGYTHEEIMDLSMRDWEYQYSQEKLRKAFQTDGGLEDLIETRHRRKDGTIYDVEISTNWATFAGKKFFFCVCRDITERKRAEQALVDEATRRRILIEQSRDGIVILDQTGKVFEANRRFAEMLGYSQEEVMKLNAWDWEYQSPPEQVKGMIITAPEEGDHFETRHRRKDGSTYDVEINTNAATFAGQKLIFCVCRDVTERKRAEQALSDEATWRRILIEESHDGIVILDQDGKVYEANRRFAEMLGYTHEEVMKLNVWDWEHQLSPEESKKALQPSGEENDQIETRHRRKDGTIFDVEICSNWATFAGKKLFFCVCRDVTERKQIEKALKESEVKFSAAFRFSPNTMAITRVKDGKFIDINNSYTRITGYTREETIGRTSIDLGLWAKEEYRRRMLEILKKNDRVDSEEFEFRMKNGEIRTWLFSAERITIGNELCIITITTDITERKRAEKLRNDENHILMMMGQGAEIHELLEAIVRLGESHDPAIKGSVMLYDAQKQLLFPAAVPSLPKVYRKQMESGIPIGQNMGTCGTSAYLKKRVITPDIRKYSIFPKEVAELAAAHGLLACWSQPIVGSNGELLGTIANYSSKTGNPSSGDIMALEWSAHIAAIAIERQRAEEALRESEEKFFKAFHASPDVIAIVRLEDSKFIEVNENFIHFNGYPRDEIIGHTATELGIWADAEERDRILKMMKERGNVRNEEFHMRTKSGEIRIGLFSAAVTSFGGEPCSIAITTDITERKQMEVELKQALEELKQSSAQLEATNKELEAFSYSVSHDLRSPLRSIDGFSQALLEDYNDKLDDTGQDYLNRLRGASQKMGELIDGILKLSRLTRNEMHLEKVDLSALAKEIATRLQETQPERRVKFVIDKGLTARGDPQLLRALLENLLGNAWKFSKKNPRARIEFSLESNGDKNKYFVRDNGAGFDMTYANKLFSAFQRLHDATEFPGTGIGLATVQRIINRHGGTIQAEGEVGKGATFYFTLN